MSSECCKSLQCIGPTTMSVAMSSRRLLRRSCEEMWCRRRYNTRLSYDFIFMRTQQNANKKLGNERVVAVQSMLYLVIAVSVVLIDKLETSRQHSVYDNIPGFCVLCNLQILQNWLWAKPNYFHCMQVVFTMTAMSWVNMCPKTISYMST